MPLWASKFAAALERMSTYLMHRIIKFTKQFSTCSWRSDSTTLKVSGQRSSLKPASSMLRVARLATRPCCCARVSVAPHALSRPFSAARPGLMPSGEYLQWCMPEVQTCSLPGGGMHPTDAMSTHVQTGSSHALPLPLQLQMELVVTLLVLSPLHHKIHELLYLLSTVDRGALGMK